MYRLTSSDLMRTFDNQTWLWMRSLPFVFHRGLPFVSRQVTIQLVMVAVPLLPGMAAVAALCPGLRASDVALETERVQRQCSNDCKTPTPILPGIKVVA